MKRFLGKVAVVTGGGGGIGSAICKRLADEGALVVVTDANAEAADDVAAGIEAAGGSAIAIAADISRKPDCVDLIEKAFPIKGRLDVLVNNSGVYEFAAIEEVTEEHYRRIFDVNVLGVLLTTQAAVKHLGEGGSVINISSVVTSMAPPASAVYTGTKGALEGINSVLAKELGPRKIRVNAILPGMVETEGAHTAGVIGSDLEQLVVGRTPLGRVGQPDDIAGVAVFLASDDARWMTGERLAASGGFR
ncbi:glucose 1-dehydrogenase [Rhizobium phaseoli]